jgi:hypothetical protein
VQPGRRGVFISYRGADTDFSPALLHQTLSRRFGRKRVFLDAESIPPGQDYVERLLSGVRSSAVLLAVITPHWLTATDSVGRRLIDKPDDWIRRELETAFAAGITVIPVFTDIPAVPAIADLPPAISRLARNQGLWLRRREYRKDLDGIVRAVKSAAPELGDRLRRRAALITMVAVVAVAGAVALGASLFVTRQGGSPPDQAPESGATLPTATSGQTAGVFWHGPVTLDIDIGDTSVSLDNTPPVLGPVGGDLELACDVGCDPRKLSSEGGLPVWSGRAPPDQRQCSDLVGDPRNAHLLDLREGTVACFKTGKNRLGYLKVTGVSASRLTLEVTVWEAS